MKKTAAIVLKSDQLNLPAEIAKKLKGKELELLETKDGILLRPLEDSIKSAKGCLKGGHFSSKKYLQLKKKEKELER
ncbi:AbrB/MazE/SpoVT family DNA-binding domain-containing protein [Candidatus Poribacteria bacterium]|nr:AbrB/MazE/SpoVT family DNA-binding domain-containing protein [Candidatus Poribacteria bacterium]